MDAVQTISVQRNWSRRGPRVTAHTYEDPIIYSFYAYQGSWMAWPVTLYIFTTTQASCIHGGGMQSAKPDKPVFKQGTENTRLTKMYNSQ